MRLVLLASACLTLCATAAVAQNATTATRDANRALAATLPFEDREDEAFATRGFIATWPDAQIKTADGRVAWDFNAYANIAGAAPDTVNPSLWRHAQLLTKHGLFKVSERIYQVRGFDVSNMTVIVGDTGLILIDPLTTAEPAKAALALVRRTLGDKPVRAVIYTHSHADHFGGVRGVVEQADVDAGRVQIIAPDGFVEHAVGENIIAGNAMSRRATFQFGTGLGGGPTASMTSGIGPAVSQGTVTMIAPTRTIKTTGETMTIDGVVVEFQMTPNTEAPSEMNLYLPQWRALCLAENANVTMHNVLTPRGALVRDTKAWADYLTESLRRYGARSDVMFTSHGWPRWETARITDFIGAHRDAYKYLHDQSVRLMNQGLNGAEIAERLDLPPSLARRWFNRGYYGTMSHNSKAVYQRYMGWYDGNPAHLEPLPHEDASKRYVAAMGGARRVIADARKSMDKGEYRWAAELLDRVVFADPANTEAKNLLAEAHTQLGYQAESAIWRNMYLTAARELRNGVNSRPTNVGSIDFIRNTPTSMVLDLLAVRLDPARAGEGKLSIALVFPDRSEHHLVTVANGVLVHEQGVSDAAQATVTMPRALFLQALLAPTPGGLAGNPAVRLEGDVAAMQRFMGLFDAPDPNFAIVTP
ncbi:MAG: alkyl sulfatase dimerization domain-containing protein [Alphaproteobacteria bacterium]|nr:alkyl sulfatase dimerization domain-containing protein [Alphaproteobacteria bacterium]